jgi:polyisoprenoid-binding protein YceI
MLRTLLAVLFFSVTSLAQQTVWNFDKAHSQVQFKVTHLVISEVTGNFRDFVGTVKTDGEDFSTAEIEFTIQTKSIDTDNGRRDAHLRSDDFFNAEKFPEIKFISKSIREIGENEYKLVGDLTIRDVTKEIELDMVAGGLISDNYGNRKAGFKVTGTIDRFDYNLKWNALLEAGGAVVGSDVDIICNVQLVKEAV